MAAGRFGRAAASVLAAVTLLAATASLGAASRPAMASGGGGGIGGADLVAVTLRKESMDLPGHGLDGARYAVLGEGDDGVIRTATSGEGGVPGELRFDLEPGTYRIFELEPPEGYCLEPSEGVLHVTAWGRATVEGVPTGRRGALLDVPLRDVRVRVMTSGDAPVEVTLRGYPAPDSLWSQTVETDEAGIATFTEVPFGLFTLTGDDASGLAPRAVSLDRDGFVSVSGAAPAGDDGIPRVYAPGDGAGTVTIDKRWVDDGTPRPTDGLDVTVTKAALKLRLRKVSAGTGWPLGGARFVLLEGSLPFDRIKWGDPTAGTSGVRMVGQDGRLSSKPYSFSTGRLWEDGEVDIPVAAPGVYTLVEVKPPIMVEYDSHVAAHVVVAPFAGGNGTAVIDSTAPELIKEAWGSGGVALTVGNHTQDLVGQKSPTNPNVELDFPWTGPPLKAPTAPQATTSDGTWFPYDSQTYVIDRDGDMVPEATLSIEGDLWRYRIAVPDPSAELLVQERMTDSLAARGYVSRGSDGHAATPEDPGVITDGHYEITNDDGHGNKGTLAVTKRLKGGDPELALADEFFVDVTLASDDPAAKELLTGIGMLRGVRHTPDSYRSEPGVTVGDNPEFVPIQDGRAVITLRVNETVTLELPAGVRWEATERSTPWEFVQEVGHAEGVIAKGETSEAEIVNARSGLTAVTIRKRVDGQQVGGDGQAYPMHVLITGLLAGQDVYGSVGGGTVHLGEANDIGTLAAEFSLKASESIVISRIPRRATVTLSEDAGDWTGRIVSPGGGEPQVLAQGEHGGVVTATFPLRDASETHEVEVENTLPEPPQSSLEIGKWVVDRDGEDVTEDLGPDGKPREYAFRISLSGLREGTVQTSVGPADVGPDGTLELPFTLRSGEVFSMPSLPAGTRYRVTEEACDMVPAYHIVAELEGSDGDEGDRLIDNATEMAKTAGTELSTHEETLEEGESDSILFVNSPPPPVAMPQSGVGGGITALVACGAAAMAFAAWRVRGLRRE